MDEPSKEENAKVLSSFKSGTANKINSVEDGSRSTVLRFLPPRTETKGSAVAEPLPSARNDEAVILKDTTKDTTHDLTENPASNASTQDNWDQEQQPGAYAHATRAPFNRRDDHVDPPVSAPMPPPTEDSNRGLVVANAIDESSRRHSDMQRAVEMDAEVDQEQSTPTSKRRLRIFPLAVCILLGLPVLVVSIPLLLAAKSKDEDKTVPIESPKPPSLAPSLSFQSHLLSLLPDATPQNLDDPESPQSQALEWTLEDVDYNPGFSDAQLIQRFSLATIYFSTQGHNWTNHDKWLSHDHHECDWHFGELFIAYGNPEFQQYPCHNETLQYERLWLAKNNLNGTLSPEITQLTSLQSFTVDRNKDLHISIPSNLNNLSHLTKWSMFLCALSGTIPTQIGLTTQLSLLYLSTSPFYKGPNKLEGTVPSQIGQMTLLEQLTLNSNHLMGSLPTQLGLLQQLSFASLEDNRFSGNIPTTLGQLTKLFALHMHWNRLTGPIASQLGLLSSSLKEFLIANNTHPDSSSLGLEGSVPSQMGLLSNLNVMFLANNPLLTGTLPTQMAQLSQIYAFDVTGTSIPNNSVPLVLQQAQEDTWFDRYVYECRLVLPCPEGRE